jgi:hypothetical protein
MEYKFESIGPTLNIVVLVFLLVFACVALGVLVVIAALPGRIARSRHHPQAEAINVCGWVGLPTGVLWALALVWAFISSSNFSVSTKQRSPKASGAGMSPQLTQLLIGQVSALENAVAALESNRQKGQA